MGLFSKAPPPPPPVTILGPRTTLEGDLKTKTAIEVHGSVKGNLSSDADVTLAPSARVDGDIACRNLECSGTAVGNLTLTGTARFSATAIWRGSLRAPGLKVEKGAAIEGQLAMSAKPR